MRHPALSRFKTSKTPTHENKIITSQTCKPSIMPGPRNDFEDVRLALSKLDLKTRGNPTLQDSEINSVILLNN